MSLVPGSLAPAAPGVHAGGGAGGGASFLLVCGSGDHLQGRPGAVWGPMSCVTLVRLIRPPATPTPGTGRIRVPGSLRNEALPCPSALAGGGGLGARRSADPGSWEALRQRRGPWLHRESRRLRPRQKPIVSRGREDGWRNRPRLSRQQPGTEVGGHPGSGTGGQHRRSQL